jgi:hypothetical protein
MSSLAQFINIHLKLETRGIDYEDQDRINTFLCDAVRTNATVVINALVELGLANQVLYEAVQQDNWALVLSLLNEATGYTRKYVFCTAAHTCDLDLVKQMCYKLNADHTKCANAALGGAAKEGNMEIIKYLLDNCRCSNKGISKALLCAMETNDNDQVADILLKAGANNWLDVFATACEYNRVSLLRQALEHVVPAENESVFQKAVENASKNGHAQVVEILVECLPETYERSTWLMNAFYYAINHDRKHVAQVLINSGVIVKQEMLQRVFQE